MFNKDFYPTPRSVAEKMLEGIDMTKVFDILEPSAGKGDLADAVKAYNDRNDHGYYSKKVYIDTIEIEPELRAILKDKEYRVVHNDFLTFSTYKQYDMIIMNPPFSDGDKHLLKAISMMERTGGWVISLLNAETLLNQCTNTRKELAVKLTDLGADVKFYKDAFKDAERKTSVDIAIVRVKIPRPNRQPLILTDLRKAEDENKSIGGEFSGIVVDDLIQSAVARFNFEAAAGMRLIDEYEAMIPYMSTSFEEEGEEPYPILHLVAPKDTEGGRRNGYLQALRMKYWDELFSNKEFSGSLTSNLQNEFRSKVNELKDYDFSLYNIYSIRLQMAQQMCSGVEETILNLFEEFSHKYAWSTEFDKNIHYYNGWKTNSAYKINKKVIVLLQGWRDMQFSWGGFKPTHYDVVHYLRDVEKVFNYLDDGSTVGADLTYLLQVAEDTGVSKKIETKYFYITFYKKGTCHLEFKDQRLLDKFNIFGSQKKGWLPPSYGKAKYEDMTKEEQEVVDQFQGREDYEKVFKEKEYYLFDSSKIMALSGGVE